MDIPPTCNVWRDQLEMSPSASHHTILQNFINDKCLPLDIEREYFDRLAIGGPPKSGSEAVRFAQHVVEMDTPAFVLKGLPVPIDRFETLVVIRKGSDLRHIIESTGGSALRTARKRTGLKLNRPFDRYSLAHASIIINAIRDKTAVPLGNRIGIVWTTEMDVVQNFLHDTHDTVDRLGLGGFYKEDYCIILAYSRDHLPETLHLPRVLDSDCNALFRPSSDCAAASGYTRPRTLSRLAADGLPEAVHRQCRVLIALADVRPYP